MHKNNSQSSPLVSIIILTMNSARFIKPCIHAIDGLDYPNYELIVVDNNSSDKTLEIIFELASERDIKVIANKENRGFAGGNNDGWKASSGEILLLLNPDTILKNGFLKAIVQPFINDPTVGIAGGKIYYPGSNILQHCGGILYPNAMSDHRGAGEVDNGHFDEPANVDYVTGAAMAVRRKVLEIFGGLDEDFYPAYYEESDLCLKARNAGWKVLYVPTAILYHHESVILEKLSRKFYSMYFRSRMIFIAKHYSLRDLMLKFLPFEVKWMFSRWANGVRYINFGSYFFGVNFIIHNWSRIKKEKEEISHISIKLSQNERLEK